MTVATARGRADGYEHGISLGNRPGHIGAKIEPLLPRVPHHQTIEIRFEYGHFALAEPRDLVGILVDAGDVVTEIGKTGAGHKPDISRANHRNAHETSCMLVLRSVVFVVAPPFPRSFAATAGRRPQRG